MDEDGSYVTGDYELKETKHTCVDCDTQFLFSLGEQQFFKEKGLTTPRRCPECRERRKKEREEKDSG